MERLEYVEPCAALETQAIVFKHAFLQAGEDFIHGSCRWDRFDSYARWLDFYRRVHEGRVADRPPSDTYFARLPGGAVLVGVMEIRHSFDERDYRFGHIGYSVAPQERGKGYGREMLTWGFARAAQLGVHDPMLCCYADNTASRRAIERSGMRLACAYKEQGSGRTVLEFRLAAGPI